MLILCLSAIALSWGQISFTAPLSFGSPNSGGKELVCIDFNKDGFLDIAVTKVSGVEIAYGTGDGTFASPTFIDFSRTVNDIKAADFDNDGNIDLVIASPTPHPIFHTIIRLKNNFPSPSFTNYGDLLTPFATGVDFLAIGDNLNDGYVDIAYMGGGNTCILNGTGSFNFSSGGCYISVSPGSIVAADFNNDGLLDYAVASGNAIRTHLNNGFNSYHSSTPSGFTPHTNDNYVYMITADHNRDGNMDLIIVNNPSTTINDAILVLAGDGTGNFTLATSYNFSNNTSDPIRIAAADFDKDFDLDLAVTVTGISGTKVRILENNGLGFVIGTDLNFTGTPRGIVSEDFNSDGKIDIAVARNDGDETYVFYNNSTITSSFIGSNVCLYFDGSSYAYGNVFSTQNKDISVECWVRVASPAQQVIFYNGNHSFMKGFGLMANRNTSGEFTVMLNGNGQMIDIPGTYPINNWYHIAITVSTTHILRFYVDGVEVHNVTLGIPITAPAVNDKIVLGGKDQFTPTFIGYLRDFRFWETQLVEATIREWMHIELNESHPKAYLLAGYCPLDEGNGNKAYDISENINPTANTNDMIIQVTASWEADIVPPIGDFGSTTSVAATADFDIRSTTGVRIDFDGAGIPGGTLVVSRCLTPAIDDAPGGVNSKINWVIRKYGGTYPLAQPIDEVELDITMVQMNNVVPGPPNSPSDFKLYKRPTFSTNPADWVLVATGSAFGSIRFGNSGSPGTGISDFSQFVIVSSATPLFIALQAFEGKRIEADKVQLRWQVTQEKNSKGFEIEKSYDVKDFFKIGYQAARGNAGIVHVYEFIDHEADEPAYYRLKMIDNDGKTQYSEIVYVGKKGQETKLMIFPNPTTGRVEIQMSKRFAHFSKLRMVVVNAQGQKMFEAEDRLLDLQIKLNEVLPKWEAGMYVMTIYDEQGAHSAKFIKE
ncbi:MAG: FG-GAP-like repeat-containing protein [Bacteroidia bacterium]|nr:FG-GAP-like repeat-containing protein [Bacteroidia bacterium]